MTITRTTRVSCISESRAIFFSVWQVLVERQYSSNLFLSFANFLLAARWFFILSVYWRWVGSLLLSKVISLTGTYIIRKNTINMHNCLKTVEKQWKPCLKEPENNLLQEQRFRHKAYVQEERWRGNSQRPALNCYLWAVGSAQKRERPWKKNFRKRRSNCTLTSGSVLGGRAQKEPRKEKQEKSFSIFHGEQKWSK